MSDGAIVTLCVALFSLAVGGVVALVKMAEKVARHEDRHEEAERRIDRVERLSDEQRKDISEIKVIVSRIDGRMDAWNGGVAKP